jgi:hypothetical protein
MKSLILILLLSTNINLHSIGIQTDSIKKNAIKIDLQSLYYSIFDAREQIRLGIEYERFFKPKLSHYTHLDFGLYDNYHYIKVYDFFGVQGGPFEDNTSVKTLGFHLLQGINFNLFKSNKDKFSINTGILFDMNVFDKKIELNSYNPNNNHTNHIKQFRIGIGANFSLKAKLINNIYFEIKHAILFNTLTSISKRNVKFIKPFKSYWYSPNQDTWLISMINLSYEF